MGVWEGGREGGIQDPMYIGGGRGEKEEVKSGPRAPGIRIKSKNEK